MFRYVIAFEIAFSGVAPGQTRNTVPSSLLLKADRPPLEVAFLLANASVPSGLEIREADDVCPKRTPDYSLDPTQQVPASDLVQAFNARHSDYHAVLMDGVFVIRPTEGTVRFLDEPSTIRPPATITGPMAAMRRIFSPLEPGLLGVVLNSYEPGHVSVVLDGTGDRKDIDTLNQIAAQTASTWHVTTQKRGNDWRTTGFGFIHKNGNRDTHPMRGQ